MSQDPLFLHTFNHLKQVYVNNYDNMNFLRRWQLESTEDQSIAVSGNSSHQILKKYVGAQFQCADCNNHWYSRIHSSILFQYNERTRTVKWKLFGQQCCRCKRNYNSPAYQEESVEESIRYLIERLAHRMHGIDFRPRDPDRPTILYNGNRHREDDLTCYCEACRLRRQYCEL